MNGRVHLLATTRLPLDCSALDVRGTDNAPRPQNQLPGCTNSNGNKVCKMQRALNAWFEDGPSKRRKTYRELAGRVLQLRGWFVERASSELLLIVVRQAFLSWPGRCVSCRKLAISSTSGKWVGSVLRRDCQRRGFWRLGRRSGHIHPKPCEMEFG